jgi:hypothetical protein
MAAAAPIIAAVSAPTITGAVLRIGISLAVSYVTNKLFAPDIPNMDTNQAPDRGVKQRIGTDTNNKLPVVYGEAKVFGSITFADITSDNQKMAFIIPLSEGPIESIDTIYWDTYELTLSNNGIGQLADVTTATDPEGNTNDFLNDGRLKIQKFISGGRCSPMESFSSKWNSDAANRTMPNVAYLYIEIKYDRDKGITGLTNKLGAVIKGRKIRTFDSLGVLSSSESYSNNPAECLLDYLTNTTYGAGNIVTDSSINLNTFYSHKQFCNETVSYTDENGNNGTDSELLKRYTTNGVVNTNDTRDIIISDLATNSSGIVSYQLGKFQLNTDKASTSQKTFSADNMFGDITIVNDGFNSQLNKFIGSFISKKNEFQDDQIYVEIPSNLKNPNEPEFTQETRFKFINNNIQAERVSNIILKKSRETLVVSFKTNISSLALQVNDVITIKNDVYNFGPSGKLFRINSISETEIQDGMLGYQITAQEYNANVYTDENISEFETAPNTNIPVAGNLSNPTGFQVATNGLNESEASITFDWAAPSTGGPVESFQIFYYASSTALSSADLISNTVLNNRLLIDTYEYPGGVIPAGTGVTHTVLDVPASPYLYFWIRSVNTYGFRSTFTTLANPVEDFTPSSVSDLAIITVYKRSSSVPTDSPTADYTHNFSSGGSFTGNTNNSNGWYLNSTDTFGSDPMYSRSASVTNLNLQLGSTDWGPVTNVSGSAGISTATIQIYTLLNGISEPSDLNDLLPTAYDYNLNTNTLNITTQPTGVSWSRTIPVNNNNKTLYSVQAYVQTNTPTVTLDQDDFNWEDVFIARNSIFEVYAYIKQNSGSNPPTPLSPQSGTGVVTNGVLTSAPTKDTNDTTTDNWRTNLTGLDITTDIVFRCSATVTGNVIGSWTTPALFILRGSQGPSGLTNLVRYASFADDATAQSTGAPTVQSGLNSYWYSSPDLLGVDSNGNPVNYTHTTTQFGSITGGSPTTDAFELTGTVTATAGDEYDRIIDYTGSKPNTRWAGQTITSGYADIDSGIDSSSTTNPKTISTIGWKTDSSRTGLNGYRLTNWTGSGSLSTGSNTQYYVYVRITFDGAGSYIPYILFRSNTNSVSNKTSWSSLDAWLDDFGFTLDESEVGTGNNLTTSNLNSDGVVFYFNDASSSAAFGGSSSPSSGSLRLIRDYNTSGDFLVQLSTNNQSSWTSLPLARIALGVGTNNAFNLTGWSMYTQNEPGSSAQNITTSSYSGDWVYDFNTATQHPGLQPNITRNGGTIYNTLYSWNVGETIDAYLTRLGNNMTTSANIVSYSKINSNTGIRVTFSNDTATYAGSMTQNNTLPSPNTNPGIAFTQPVINGQSPQSYIIDITPTFKSNIDYASLTNFRYSDAYTDTLISDTYDNTISSNNGILTDIVNTLNAQSHMSASVNGNSIRLTFTNTINYGVNADGNVATGPTSGVDARVPQPFINFGSDTNGVIITNMSISTQQTGNGAGNLVTTRPTATFNASISNSDPYYNAFNSYSITIDEPESNSGHATIMKQIYNAALVLFNDIFQNNNAVTGTNTTLTTIDEIVSPNKNLTVTGSNFSNTEDLGQVGDPYSITIQRTNADERNNITVNISLTSNQTAQQVLDSVLTKMTELGSFGKDLGNGIFQIQDAGTGPTNFSVSVTNGSGITVTHQSNLQDTGTSPSFSDLDADRWTRPVNTGVQV